MNFNYEIKCTPPYGEGIFTRVAIPAGTCVWFYKLNVNVLEFDENQSIAHLTNLKSLAEQQRFLDLTFGKQNVLCLITDDGQYMNHAEKTSIACNCKTDLISGNCYAIRDISVGEQLFEDYSEFSHPTFLYPLLEEYKCAPTYYSLPN